MQGVEVGVARSEASVARKPVIGVVGIGRTGEPKMKRKKTKQQKLLAKEKLALDEAAWKIQVSGEPYLNLVDRLDRWLGQNQSCAVELLQEFIVDGSSEVSYKHFKAAMRDLRIPCTGIELHLLCVLLDFNQNEVIDIRRLENGLSFVRAQQSHYQATQPSLRLTNEKYARCSKGQCAIAHWNGEPYKVLTPRYLLIHFRLASFDQFKDHAGHFSSIVPLHTTGLHLVEIISDKTLITMSRATIYTSKSCALESILHPDLTLEECGFEGGSQNAPKELVLYYDYILNVDESPLLLCDHYFVGKSKVSKVH